VDDDGIGEVRRSTADRVAIPHALFMSPPLATVGLTEKEAREAGYRVKIANEPVAEIVAMPRAYIVEETRGLMKFVSTPRRTRSSAPPCWASTRRNSSTPAIDLISRDRHLIVWICLPHLQARILQLLYAQPVSRLVRLTLDDVIRDED
jgi:Pyridine nucleotide-disulphide oxidoreductase, dimerisation domain